MRTGHFAALLALSAAAGAADASAFVEVLINGSDVWEDDLASGPFEVSVWLDRNGSTDGFFASFQGWSNFAGTLSIGGPNNLLLVPVEGVTPGQTQADPWEGRRPPAFPVPGGAGGGFRFAPAGAAPGVDQYGNHALVGIEGIQASAALGGFSQDTSPRVEVFRASVDLTGQNAGAWEIGFIPTGMQVAISPDFNIQRAVFNEIEFRTAWVGVLGFGDRWALNVPTPASGVLMFMAFAASMTRRRR